MKKNFENTIPIGTTLNGKKYQYEIIRVLGQGSFGITYLASIKVQGELGSITAYVAIKEFFMSEINGRDNSTVTSSNKDGLFDKYKSKFIKEAQSLGRLNHTNIVKVLEMFEANNTAYYVMDFLEGGSLDEYIAKKGSLDEDESLEISTQIVDALSYMHSRNMLHLDLKPSNIMMYRGRPVLIDFGLSKQYDEKGNPESSTTIGGGTPGYAPLEQSNFNGEIDSPRQLPVTMDFYALGGTLFKMMSGNRPPMASNILNLGFPEEELKSKGISSGARNLIKSLMMPMWKERPQTDMQVKKMFNELGNSEDEDTVFPEEQPEINREPERFHPKEEDNGGEKPRKKIMLIVAITAVVLGILSFIIFYNPKGGKIYNSADSIVLDTALFEESEVENGDLPEITYSIQSSTGEPWDENSQLCATINGEKVVIGSISYIFGRENNANMAIFAQEDFDNDGVKDVLVYDSNLGSGGGTTWAFVSYAGNNSFNKSSLFSEASYYDIKITTVNGQKVVDFVKEDMGQQIVKERHALKNGNVITLDLPKSTTSAYTPLKSIDMESLGEDGSFSFDLNGDGVKETIKTTGSYHFGRDFNLKMNGREYEFTIDNALWGAGTLHILKSVTNGMHDLMSEQDTRVIYKWDGSTYAAR